MISYMLSMFNVMVPVTVYIILSIFYIGFILLHV